MKTKKKKRKYQKWIDIDDDSYSADTCCSYPCCPIGTNYLSRDQDNIPSQMQLNTCDSLGLYFGYKTAYDYEQYTGLQQGKEGNVLIVGRNGSGKSSGITKPILYTWHEAMCVTDIKGEMSDFYQELYQRGLVKRPFIIFAPTQIGGIGYDPFYLPKQDKDNLVNYSCAASVCLTYSSGRPCA